MNLQENLLTKTLDSVTYDGTITEWPMSHLIDFDFRTILPPPPKNSSGETKRELEYISRQTKNRSKNDIEFIHKMDEDIDSFYKEIVYKKGYNYPENYISLFYDIVETPLMNTKWYWNRARPKVLSKYYGLDVNVIVTDTIHTPSYPSGHTAYSQLVANILSDLYPDLSSRLNKIPIQTGIARVKQGVHYPSDNKAGILFANFVFKALSPKLKKFYTEEP